MNTTSPVFDSSHSAMDISAKRKSPSSTNDVDTTRPVKRRASKACLSCRARKVRCDLILNGLSCTNCRLDDMDCTVSASRKSRSPGNKKRNDQSQPVEQSSPKIPAANAVRTSPAATNKQQVYLTPVSEATDDEIPVCLTFEGDEAEIAANMNEHSHDFGDPSLRQSTSPGSLSVSASISSSSSSSARLGPPAFIKPLSSSLQSEDLEYLIRKGALQIPTGGVLVRVLQAYMSGVHVFMPIVNMKQILEAVSRNDINHQISLLVFQAMIFAAMAHVPDDCVREMGYTSVKEARKACFRRAQLLYDIDAEQDDISVLQSLLLMSFVYEKRCKRRQPSYWTGLALSHAQTMGLDRSPSTVALSLESQALHKRLWWSLYIRDRLIGLGLRRPMRISDDDFQVPGLVISDFDTSAFSVDLPTSHGRVTIRQERESATLLATICVELSRLCVRIGHILSTQYTVIAQKTELTDSTMIRPRSHEQRSRSLSHCCKGLREWYEVLDPKLRPFALDRGSDISRACTEIHWPILHMIYRTAIIVLHRPNMSQCPSDQTQDLQNQVLSCEKVIAAARTLTSIGQTIYRQGHIHLLPTTGVSAQLAASLAHLSTIKSSNDDTRDASAYRFCQSMQILQQLQKVYDSADSTVAFLAVVLRKSGLNQHIALKQFEGVDLLPFYDNTELSGTRSWSQVLQHSALQLQGGNDDNSLHQTTFDPMTSTSQRPRHHDGDSRVHQQSQHLADPTRMAAMTTTQDNSSSICTYPFLPTLPSTASLSTTTTPEADGSFEAENMFQDMFSAWTDKESGLNTSGNSGLEMMHSIDPYFECDADGLTLWDTAEAMSADPMSS